MISRLQINKWANILVAGLEAKDLVLLSFRIWILLICRMITVV